MRRPSRAILFALATSTRFEALVRGAPGGEALAWRRARRYVAGAGLDEVLDTLRPLAARGLGLSVDLFGEAVTDPAQARRVATGYEHLAQAVAPLHDAWLSLDLSHLALDTDPRLARALLERVAAALPPGRRLEVGAEDAARTDAVLDTVLRAASAGAPLVATVQANLRRSPADARRLVHAGVPIRLVKGAYLEPAAIAHPYGEATDLAYLSLARGLRAAGAPTALATHDPLLREALLPGLPRHDELQLLFGVRPGDADALAAAGHRVRLYAPFGPGWFRYWMRRLAESRGT